MATNMERAQRVAELAQERVGLLERLAEVEQELLSEVGGTGTATTVAPKSRQGRPPGGSGNKDRAIVVMGGNKRKPAAVADDGKEPDLPTLLAQIASEAKKPLKLPEFVQLAREAGYQTEAKDFSNMVYQALLKLVKRKVLEKDQENRNYLYVGRAA